MTTMQDVTAEADRAEAQLQDAVQVLRERIAGDPDFRPSEAIELCRLAADILNEVASEPTPEEYLQTMVLESGATAQLLLAILPPEAGEGHYMNGGTKAFWCQVAEDLGPDWIEALRVVAAFMKRVEGFQPNRGGE